MRPTSSDVHIVMEGGRRNVFVRTVFTDRTPHEHLHDIRVEVRDKAVCLSNGREGQLYLTLESLPFIVEAIQQAKVQS